MIENLLQHSRKEIIKIQENFKEKVQKEKFTPDEIAEARSNGDILLRHIQLLGQVEKFGVNDMIETQKTMHLYRKICGSLTSAPILNSLTFIKNLISQQFV